MRLQALGAKASLFKQEKMPMAMRKGMARAAGDKEERRRREARENGIVLERFGGGGGGGGKKKTGGGGKGFRPVDLPGVGKMRGAELRISARDVRDIESGGNRGGRGGGRGGGMGGKRRR